MDDDAKPRLKFANRRVRLGLLLTQIGRENKIEVTRKTPVARYLKKRVVTLARTDGVGIFPEKS